ncbi:MAG: dephospho-CoA kinase [Defluviitaleaceae bacterium]|nr:dephospho-CoA kinase [Defluviitaleaceae bacterium]
MNPATPNQTIIGITGGSGAGKGEVCKILSGMGVFIINADAIGHQILLKSSPTAAYDDIVATFGVSILDKDGEINRKALGNIVFADKAKLETLNHLTHKHIIKEIRRIISTQSSNIIAIDAALLVEAGLHKICHKVIGVFADMDVRLDRITQRDGITLAQAKSRIASQMPDATLAGYVDVQIINNGNLEELERQVAYFIVI